MSDDPGKVLPTILTQADSGGFQGYDPYDCLRSKFMRNLPGRYTRIAATQFFVYSPLNLRSLFGIGKGVNPKAVALFLDTCSRLDKIKGVDIDQNKMLSILKELKDESMNDQHSGPCWGYNFPWQDLHKFIPIGQPSVVVTSYMAKAICSMDELENDEKNVKEMKGICDFISKDLNRYTDDEGICLSYSPFDDNIVHNANLFGAVTLLRYERMSSDDTYRDLAEKCFNFSLSKQHEDGSFAYSQDRKGTERNQIDFHQGFIVEAIMDYIEMGGRSSLARTSLEKALEYYFTQFREEGGSYWRIPRKWPIDIHHQAQGLIVFSRCSNLDKKYGDLADSILDWTLKNMYSGNGKFIYQVWPLFRNRISFIRWGNAWMARSILDYMINNAQRGE